VTVQGGQGGQGGSASSINVQTNGGSAGSGGAGGNGIAVSNPNGATITNNGAIQGGRED
jgi:hypothetical protein